MAVVFKHRKQAFTVTGCKNWTASQWGKALLNETMSKYWGFPKSITSNRDSKLHSAQWKTVWQSCGSKLLHTSACHTQADGQTERVIQVFQSGIWHYIHSLENQKYWFAALPQLLFVYNNTPYVSTGMSPNQCVMEFMPNKIATSLNNKIISSQMSLPLVRIAAHDAIL